jgi:TPR repeat protein
MPLLKVTCEEHNDGASCTALGHATENGNGVPQDLARARAYYEKACELNDPGGCSSLGHMLLDGLGGPVDVPRGIEVIETSCGPGHSEPEGRACFRYAEMLLDGRLPPNDELAYDKAMSGCVRKYAQACALQGRLLMQGRGTKHANTIDGAALLKQACDLGDAQACIDYSHTGSGWSEQQQQTFGGP